MRNPWINQFCKKRKNAWYVKIDEKWVSDWFNQHGIDELFPHFKMAMRLITNRTGSKWLSLTQNEIATINTEAEHIYGLLHARYICQPRGLELMRRLYDKKLFGKCPRYACHGTQLIPMGTTFTPRKHSTKLFCPCCYDIYRAPNDMITDGAHFGPAFPHIFLLEYPDLDRHNKFTPFTLTAFGFPIRRSPEDEELPHDRTAHLEEFINTNEDK